VDTTTTATSGVLEVLPMGDVASAGGGIAMTSDDDGDELEVIMGCPGL
jgi:hypothetical protein